MKIVFLDFDGVLAPIGVPYPAADAAEQCRPHVERLNRITDLGGAAIVASTSWKYAWPDHEAIYCCASPRIEAKSVGDDVPPVPTAVRCHGCWGCEAASVAELGMVLRALGVRAPVVGVTPHRSGPRGGQIAAWLVLHRRDLESFVVLDDTDDMDPVSDRLVLTSLTVALQDEHVDLALALLEAPWSGELDPFPDPHPDEYVVFVNGEVVWHGRDRVQAVNECYSHNAATQLLPPRSERLGPPGTRRAPREETR